MTTPKRLTRSSSDRVIAGVAGGIGRYFNIDPVVVRLILIVLAFFGGAGLIAYLAAWLIVPSEGSAGDGFDTAGLVRRGAILLGVLILTGIAVIGGVWGFGMGGGTATAIVVIGVGLLLVAGAFTGGMRWLLVPAIALALAAGATAAGNVDLRGGSGERIYSPATTAQLRPTYKLGIGHLRLDLRDTKFTPGPHRVDLKLGVGEAEVLVPNNICVSAVAHVALGGTAVLKRTTVGSYRDFQNLHSPSARTPHLIVNAHIGFGLLRIEPEPQGSASQPGVCGNE